MISLPQVTEDYQSLGYEGNLGCLFLNTTGLRRRSSKDYVFLIITCLERNFFFENLFFHPSFLLSLFFYVFESVFLSIGSQLDSTHMITVGVVIK